MITKYWKATINMDGRGYYAYLPAVFIYDDLTCSFIKTEPELQPDSADFMNKVDGKLVNKYFVGEAICQLPFFATAHFVAKMMGERQSGYTKPYQYGVAIAVVCYFLLGLFFLWGLLETFHFKKGIIFFVCFCIAFGTNLFYYATHEPSMSHAYSFGIITCFLFFTRSFFLAPSSKKLLLLATLLGIVVLLRPVNLMILLTLPLMAGDWTGFKNALIWISNNFLILFISLTLFLLIISIQFALYYWQTGHFILWSYSSEGFNFMHPHIYGTLFSFEKGLFVYVPILLIAISGVVVMIIRSKYLGLSLLIALSLIAFIISSWHDWRYGFSFGARAYIDFYALFALPFAFLLDFVLKNKILFTLTLTVCVSLTVLYRIQEVQFVNRIIHPYTMNQERYWMVFLHTENKYRDTLSRIPFIMESEGNFNDMEGSVDWPGMETIKKGLAYSGNYSSRIDSASPYSVGFSKIMSDKEFNSACRIQISAWVMRENTTDEAQLVIVEKAGDSTYYYQSISLPKFTKKGEWKNINTSVIVPERRGDNEYLKVFFARYKGVIYIDDLTVQVLE